MSVGSTTPSNIGVKLLLSLSRSLQDHSIIINDRSGLSFTGKWRLGAAWGNIAISRACTGPEAIKRNSVRCIITGSTCGILVQWNFYLEAAPAIVLAGNIQKGRERGRMTLGIWESVKPAWFRVISPRFNRPVRRLYPDSWTFRGVPPDNWRFRDNVVQPAMSASLPLCAWYDECGIHQSCHVPRSRRESRMDCR